MAGPRHCAVCDHPDRAAIDSAILNGKSMRSIARTFGIVSVNGLPDHTKVARHRDNCLPNMVRAAVTAAPSTFGNALASRMQQLDRTVNEVLRRLRRGQPVLDADGQPLLRPDAAHPDDYQRVYDDRTILAAVREARANVETIARLSGAIPDTEQAALERDREAQAHPEVRRLLAEAERLLAEQKADQQGQPDR